MTQPASGGLRELGRDRIALALVLAGALVRAVFLLEVLVAGVDLRPRINVDSYMYHRNAVRIVAGDLLLRDRYDFSGTTPDEPGHPRTSGPIQVLGAERYDREYGPHAYYDSPGYSYLVAATYALFGTDSRAVLVLQEALDLVACVLVYLVGLRLYDRTVARVALAFVAFDATLVFYAGFFLRDSLITSLVTIVLYLVLRSADDRRGPGASVAAGVAWGVAWIVKSIGVFLLPWIVLAILAPPAAAESWRRRATRLAAFGAGAALAMAPFVARNVSLGVPPLRMTTGDISSLLCFNAPNAGTRGFVLNLEDGKRAAARCERLTAFSALAAAASLHSSTGAFARQGLARAANLWVADDAWDNVRLSWLAPCLRSLRLAPVRWKLVAPFALVGIALALADPRRRHVVLAPLAAVTAISLLSTCLTRYRLNAEPFTLLLAASGLAWMLREARARRRRALVVAGLCVLATLVLHDPEPPPRAEQIEGYVRGSFSPRTASYLLEGNR